MALIKTCAVCGRTLGKWTGQHVLRRRDLNGTQWEIRRAVFAPARPDVAGRDYILIMTYRQHRLTSWHTSPEAAKDHVDDVIQSWTARTLRDYEAGRR